MLPGFKSNHNFIAKIKPCPYEIQRKKTIRPYTSYPQFNEVEKIEEEVFSKISINENEFYSIQPNPSNGVFSFNTNYNGTMQLNIYNYMGSKVAVYKNVTTRAEIDLRNHSVGIFILQIQTDDGKSTSYRIVTK